MVRLPTLIRFLTSLCRLRSETPQPQISVIYNARPSIRDPTRSDIGFSLALFHFSPFTIPLNPAFLPSLCFPTPCCLVLGLRVESFLFFANFSFLFLRVPRSPFIVPCPLCLETLSRGPAICGLPAGLFFPSAAEHTNCASLIFRVPVCVLPYRMASLPLNCLPCCPPFLLRGSMISPPPIRYSFGDFSSPF